MSKYMNNAKLCNVKNTRYTYLNKLCEQCQRNEQVHVNNDQYIKYVM